VKTVGAIAALVAVVVVARVVTGSYCAWSPDTVIGMAVKWVFWDHRMC
jgi:hypothetical protein